jgi:virginiamycin B lyase
MGIGLGEEEKKGPNGEIEMRMAGILALMLGAGGTSLPLATAAEPTVVVQEYDLPTPASRPHDPALGPDGSLWYTAQMANKLGRLDPHTGEIKEYPLKTADSGPHGLVADKQGNIWFTAAFKGYVGELDPKTGAIKEYQMPDPRARDPHTPVFDPHGILWFTVQSGNFIGRLDPNTGAVKLKEVPTPRAVPYGILISSAGVPYFCEFGTNRLASIDPASMKITEYLLPAGARPRRLAITREDVIYYADYGRGNLGRFDPKTGKVEEWASPGGPDSKPYGIAVTPDGMVWYSEAGMRPNTIVRFDPGRKEFSTWPIPSGGGVVRNMVATPKGDLYIACSGVNKVGIVRIHR